MADKRIYIVNFRKHLTQMLLVDMRTPKQKAWVNALISQLVDLYNRFINYRNYINYQLSITPQACYVQMALNDKYDTSQRRITIVKPAKKLPVVLFTKNENKPVKLYRKSENSPVILYTKGETAQFTVDFIVKVPVGVLFDANEMTAFISNYVLPSKTFKIMIF